MEEAAPKRFPLSLPSCCLISSVLCKFSLPFLHPKYLGNATNLHHSMLSIPHRCIQMIHNFSAENPLAQGMRSLSIHFRNFTQMRCRNPGLQKSLPDNFAAILPGDSVATVVVANGILNFLNIYNSLLVIRLVLTWFPNSPPAIVSPLSTLCDPYLNIFRGIIPPLGGTLDLSPILAFLVLNAFTSTAAALPAELPVNGAASQHLPPSSFKPWSLTTLQQKWIRRVSAKRTEDCHDNN